MRNTSLEITPDELAVIAEVVSKADLTFNDEKVLESTFEAQRCFSLFPKRVRKSVFEFKSEGLPLLHITGFQDLVPNSPTPLEKAEKSQSPVICQKILGVFSVALGYVYRFSNKSSKDYFDDIFPIQKDSTQQIGSNSVFLDWHVEDAPLQGKADYLCMFCIRPDEKVNTLVFHGQEFKSQAKTAAAYLSERNNFRFKTDLTFEAGHQTEKATYVLEDSADPEFIYDPSYMSVANDTSREALDQIQRYIQFNHQAICLQKGDLLVLDNRRVAHARTPNYPKYNGQDRWLLRSLVIESAWKMKDIRTEHLLVLKGDC